MQNSVFFVLLHVPNKIHPNPKIMLVDENPFDGCHDLPLSSSSSSLRDVDYSCGSCGYELNLNSCNRNASGIGSKRYGKSIKRGIISFFSIDETRFTQIEQLRCKPYFASPRSWGLFQRRIKLLCRNCGNHVGSSYQSGNGVRVSYSRSLKLKEYPVSASSSSSSSSSWGWDGISGAGTFDIRIRALQPSSYHGPDPNIFCIIEWSNPDTFFLFFNLGVFFFFVKTTSTH